jgi:hypothetical protein
MGLALGIGVLSLMFFNSRLGSGGWMRQLDAADREIEI